MNRVAIVIGLLVGGLLALAVVGQIQYSQHRIASAPHPLEAREVQRPLMQEPDPIYTAADALARTMPQWPEHLDATQQVVRLLTYGDFASWAFEYNVPDPEPVWVVAMSAAGAKQSDFGFDPSDDPVDGFWYQWKACSGEQLSFGGLTGAKLAALQAMPNQSLTIEPCDLRPTGVPATSAPPWEQ